MCKEAVCYSNRNVFPLRKSVNNVESVVNLAPEEGVTVVYSIEIQMSSRSPVTHSKPVALEI
jgi:hypothetical protein